MFVAVSLLLFVFPLFWVGSFFGCKFIKLICVCLVCYVARAVVRFFVCFFVFVSVFVLFGSCVCFVCWF